MLIEVTSKPISPESVVRRVKTNDSGCVATYVGLIRKHSHDKAVLSVEYQDIDGTAENKLYEIAAETMQKWQVNNIAICHRTGRLKVGYINLVVTIAAAHREEGFAACRYVIDRFKERLPTRKTETYENGSTHIGEE